MKKQHALLMTLSAWLFTLGMASSADAALLGRLETAPGSGIFQAYYDDVANLTWLADANYAATSGYAGANANGAMTWQAANTWAAQLTVGGVGGWRLPDTIDTGTSGCNYSTTGGTDCGYNVDTATGELANLYYNVLGNLAYYDTSGNPAQPGYGLQNTGPFSNVQSVVYWTATEYAPSTNGAWFFGMGNGRQLASTSKGNRMHGWAVQSGDVSAVPVPAAVWLFGSGLLGLVGVARRKSANI